MSVSTMKYNQFDLAKLELAPVRKAAAAAGSSKLSTYFFQYDGKQVPKIQIDKSRVIFPIRYEQAPQLKLSLAINSDLVAFFTALNERVHHLLTEGGYLKKNKDLTKLVSGVPDDEDDEGSTKKSNPFVRIKIGDVDKAPFDLGIVDLDTEDKKTISKKLSVDELQEILIPRAEVTTIVSINFAYISSLAAGLTLKLAAIAYNSQQLEQVRSFKVVKDPLFGVREISDIDFSSLVLKPVESNPSLMAIQDENGKTLKLRLPPTKISMRPQFDVESKPKLNLAVQDSNVKDFFEALETWVLDKKNQNKSWKKLKYYGLYKPATDPKYAPRVAFKFNGGADGKYSINWFGDNMEIQEKYDPSNITIDSINEFCIPGALVEPVVSIRSIFFNKTMVTVFAFVDALNIIGYPNVASFQFDPVSVPVKKTVDVVEEEVIDA